MSKKLWALLIVLSGLALWGSYKFYLGSEAKRVAKLEQDYKLQKDSTKAWRSAYTASQLQNVLINDSLAVLRVQRDSALNSADRYHIKYITLAGKAPPAPATNDSTNPRWMHRAINLEGQVSALVGEVSDLHRVIASDSNTIQLFFTKKQQDSLLLASASGNITRLNSLVEGYRKKATCRIGWVIPCPSRPQAFIVGAVTVLALQNAGRLRSPF